MSTLSKRYFLKLLFLCNNKYSNKVGASPEAFLESVKYNELKSILNTVFSFVGAIGLLSEGMKHLI